MYLQRKTIKNIPKEYENKVAYNQGEKMISLNK